MTKTAKIVNIILTVILLAVIFLFAYKTIVPNAQELRNSMSYMSRIGKYLDDTKNYTPLELLNARIRSVENKFNNVLWKKEELGYLNSTFQYMIGKRMISTGGTNMVTLDTGGLYDIQDYVDLSRRAEEIIALRGMTDKPFLFVYEHPTLYSDAQLSGGYLALDHGKKMGDEVVSLIKNAGIDTIDSRDILADYPIEKTIFDTDQHWTPYAGLAMARAIAEYLGWDTAPLADENMNFDTYENLFLGKYGQRVGTMNIEPDDYTLVTPKEQGEYSRETIYNGEETRIDGGFATFNDALLKTEYLDCEDGKTYNLTAYQTYGLREDFEHYHNYNAPQRTLVIFKDSYSCPVGCFLSMLASDVYLFDMRTCPENAMYYIEKYNPDNVIVSYSRQMLVDNEYDLIEGFE